MTSTPQTATVVAAEISTLIDASTSSVKAAYVQAAVDKEVTNRVDLFTKAMDKLKSLKSDLNKIKPDNKMIQLGRDPEGKETRTTVESYSAETLKKKDKLFEQVNKLDQAITDYLSDAEFTDPNKAPIKVLKETLAKCNEGGDKKADD